MRLAGAAVNALRCGGGDKVLAVGGMSISSEASKMAFSQCRCRSTRLVMIFPEFMRLGLGAAVTADELLLRPQGGVSRGYSKRRKEETGLHGSCSKLNDL